MDAFEGNGCSSTIMIFWLMMMTLSSWNSNELGLGLERETARSHALPDPIQDLTTLGLLATGSLQRELADRGNWSGINLAVINWIIHISARYHGAINCTHIAIKRRHMYHFHSLNLQIICDAQMRLTNIVAWWPGSTHDSIVLSNGMTMPISTN